MIPELLADLPYEIWLDLCEETGIPVDELRALFMLPAFAVGMPIYTRHYNEEETTDNYALIDADGSVNSLVLFGWVYPETDTDRWFIRCFQSPNSLGGGRHGEWGEGVPFVCFG